MSAGREERRAANEARKAERHAAKADRKRATAQANLSLVAVGEPATPQARRFTACPCPKDCTLHGECLPCVAFHAGRGSRAVHGELKAGSSFDAAKLLVLMNSSCP